MRLKVVCAISGALILMAAPIRGSLVEQGLATVAELRGETGVTPPPGSLLSRKAEIRITGVSISEALTRLSEATDVSIAFSPNFLPSEQRVLCDCSDLDLATALDRILEGTDFGYVEFEGQIVVSHRESGRNVPLTEPSPMRLASLHSMGGYVDGLSRAPRIVGTLTGRVVDQLTRRPLAGAQVTVEGTGLGGLAGTDGNFTIRDVPAGQATVEVRYIGYATQTFQVAVQDGETTLLDVELRQSAVSLDEIVVTGTAGGTQVRAIGNVVEAVDAASVIATMPVTDVNQLIGGRTPGLTVLPAAGQVGTGSAIRIRGTGSMSLSNEPIVFIDGVRMDSDPRGGPSQRGGARVSRLSDLNPEDIQSIEIIKGPSAATLYGTEASNGVIQVITKRGSAGRPQVDVTLRMGTNWIANPEGRTALRWYVDPATGEPRSVNMYIHERENGSGDIFTFGRQQGGSASVSGGSETVRYFISGSYDDDTGIVPWNWDRRLSTMASLDLVGSEKFTARVSSNVISRRTRLAQANFDSDPMSNLVWANPRTINEPLGGWMQAPPSEWSKFESRSGNDRAITSAEFNFRPLENFHHRLVAGLDMNHGEYSSLWPRQEEGQAHFWGQNALGRKDVTRTNTQIVTLDYSGSLEYGLIRNVLGATTSVGFQYYRRSMSGITADGRIFPALPITTIDGGSTRTSSESLIENATVGMYVQQQFDWKNRIFITGAIRGDDNSAFGAEYDAAIYPKLSGSWVINEEDFWNIDAVSQLKLRAAWGAAGQQPGSFDAPRLYDPQVGFENLPTLVPSSFGNPQLRPERSEELEFGFDASLFGDRVEVNVTRFHRTVTDAIVNRPVPPSTGFPGSQIVNVATVKGWGNEIGIHALMLERPSFSWDMGVQYSTNGDRIEDLGGMDVITAGLRFEHRPGFPIGGIFLKNVLSAQIDDDGELLEAICDGGTGRDGIEIGGAPVACDDAPRLFFGPSTPTWQFGWNSTFTFFRNLRLYARIEGNGGHRNINTEMRASHNTGITLPTILRNDPMVQATRIVENDAMGLYDAAFAKLREVSLSYTLPEGLAQRVGASRGSVTVAGRNLMMLWTGHHGFNTPRDGRVPQLREIGGEWTWDPETRSMGQIAGDYQTVLPPTASMSLAVRFSF